MKKTDERPLMVSIKCCVYNHEPYLRQCLDGIVMQKTDFRFEAIVNDDASTDKSADIIREYAGKYPEIITPVFHEENVYSKDKDLQRRQMNALCKGKYIAICEGDDFWTDPLKLQKQIDYLESHPDCSLCFTAADVLLEKGVPDCDTLSFSGQKTRDIYSVGNDGQWNIPTATIVHINDMHDYPYDPRFLYGDGPLILFMLQKGYLHCIGEITATYRRNPTSVTFRTVNCQRVITHYEAIVDVFGKKYTYAEKKIVSLYLKVIRLGKMGKESWKAIFAILKNPRYLIQLFKVLPEVLFRNRKKDSKRVRYVIK